MNGSLFAPTRISENRYPAEGKVETPPAAPVNRGQSPAGPQRGRQERTPRREKSANQGAKRAGNDKVQHSTKIPL